MSAAHTEMSTSEAMTVRRPFDVDDVMQRELLAEGEAALKTATEELLSRRHKETIHLLEDVELFRAIGDLCDFIRDYNREGPLPSDLSQRVSSFCVESLLPALVQWTERMIARGKTPTTIAAFETLCQALFALAGFAAGLGNVKTFDQTEQIERIPVLTSLLYSANCSSKDLGQVGPAVERAVEEWEDCRDSKKELNLRRYVQAFLEATTLAATTATTATTSGGSQGLKRLTWLEVNAVRESVGDLSWSTSLDKVRADFEKARAAFEGPEDPMGPEDKKGHPKKPMPTAALYTNASRFVALLDRAVLDITHSVYGEGSRRAKAEAKAAQALVADVADFAVLNVLAPVLVSVDTQLAAAKDFSQTWQAHRAMCAAANAVLALASQQSALGHWGIDVDPLRRMAAPDSAARKALLGIVAKSRAHENDPKLREASYEPKMFDWYTSAFRVSASACLAVLPSVRQESESDIKVEPTGPMVAAAAEAAAPQAKVGDKRARTAIDKGESVSEEAKEQDEAKDSTSPTKGHTTGPTTVLKRARTEDDAPSPDHDNGTSK